MIHVYHGDGKGKTTAAIGLSIRAAGSGKRVVFAQFLKGSDTSELSILMKIENIEVCRNEKDFGFLFQMTEEEKKELVKMHNQTLRHVIQLVKEKKVDMVVLDEITYPYEDKLLDCKALEQFIETLGEEVELVLTGRNPTAFFLDKADYITNMTCVRHPFEKNQPARKGIEF